MIKGKKGASLWLSWVLLLVFVVVLSAIIFNWMKLYTESSADDMRQRVFNAEECNFISISVSEVVEKNPQTLNMKVSNRNNLRINQIMFRLYDEDNNVYVGNMNITIKPEQSKTIEISKNETIDLVEVIPIRFDENYVIICRDRMVRVKI